VYRQVCLIDRARQINDFGVGKLAPGWDDVREATQRPIVTHSEDVFSQSLIPETIDA